MTTPKNARNLVTEAHIPPLRKVSPYSQSQGGNNKATSGSELVRFSRIQSFIISANCRSLQKLVE